MTKNKYILITFGITSDELNHVFEDNCKKLFKLVTINSYNLTINLFSLPDNMNIESIVGKLPKGSSYICSTFNDLSIHNMLYPNTKTISLNEVMEELEVSIKNDNSLENNISNEIETLEEIISKLENESLNVDDFKIIWNKLNNSEIKSQLKSILLEEEEYELLNLIKNLENEN